MFHCPSWGGTFKGPWAVPRHVSLRACSSLDAAGLAPRVVHASPPVKAAAIGTALATRSCGLLRKYKCTLFSFSSFCADHHGCMVCDRV